MAGLKWDLNGERLFETGTDHGVLYPIDETTGTFPKGVAWNGLTGVSESPTGAEPTAEYADNIKYANVMSAEEFAATIEAFMWPDEFNKCDGSATLVEGVTIGQQTRKSFGFSYRTLIGNDTKQNDYGYKLHLVYNCLASPSSKEYQTVNDTPELTGFSWEISTTPVPVSAKDADGNTCKPTATLVIDSTKFTPEQMKALEDVLYGVDADPSSTPPVVASEARLPLPDEVLTILAEG